MKSRILFLFSCLALCLLADVYTDLQNAPEESVEIVKHKGTQYFKIGDTLYPPVLMNYSTDGQYTNTNFKTQLKGWADGGLRLISFGIDAEYSMANGKRFWYGPNQYDWTVVDKELENAFNLSPDGRVIFAITFCHGPTWWDKRYRDDAIKYARIDTNYSSGDCIGNFPSHSLGSERWRIDASEAVRKLVEHIESTPYAKRIIGYRIGDGVYSEWVHFGMANAMPDISPAMVTYFRSFLREKYDNNVLKLRESWKQPNVTFESALPPPVDVRLQCVEGTLMGTPLRDPRNRWLMDFLKCMQMSVRDSLLAMNKAAKEACGGKKLIGNYCGYFFGQGYTSDGWQIETDDILDSPYVDFLIAPTCYTGQFRNVGCTQLTRSLVSSFALRNKLCIIEADTRTHLTADSDGNKTAKNAQESVALMARDMAQAISRGCAFWYYDLGRVWYYSSEILDLFKKIIPVYNAVPDFSSSAGIAIIADWESVYYHAVQELKKHPDYQYTTFRSGRQAYSSINYIPVALSSSGMVYDLFSFNDIDNPAMDKYKIYIFPQLFYVTPEKLAKLETLKKAGKTLIFLNQAGWLTPDGPDVNSIYQTTGIQVELLNQVYRGMVKLNNGTTMDTGNNIESVKYLDMYPTLKITDSSATILGTVTTSSGKPNVNAYAKKVLSNGATVYLCGSPFISGTELKRIAAEAGVHSYCDSDKGVVYANNSMISFHTATAGTYTLKAPKAVKWKMVYPNEETYPGSATEHSFTITQPDTYIFVVEE